MRRTLFSRSAQTIIMVFFFLLNSNNIFGQDSYEKELYEKVRNIPGSNVQENRDGYKKLLEINPNNETYKKKFEYYDSLSKKNTASKSSLTSLIKSYDDIKKVAWYRDRRSPKYDNRNGFFLYIGKDETFAPWLRLRIQYKGDDWLFIEKYIIKTDEKLHYIVPKVGEIERDNGYGDVWEWCDLEYSNPFHIIVMDIIKSKTTKIRYEGKRYYRDRIITEQEKSALSNIIKEYNGFGGTQYKIE